MSRRSMIGANATTHMKRAKDGEDKLAIGGVVGEGDVCPRTQDRSTIVRPENLTVVAS
jgi:hypothetical protein